MSLSESFEEPARKTSGPASARDLSVVASPVGAPARDAAQKARMDLHLLPDSGSLSRILAPFEKQGIVLHGMVLRSETADSQHLQLQFQGVSERECEKIAATLRRIVGVQAVLLTL